MSSILTVSNLNYDKEGKFFFKDFNLEIKEGSITSIIAPNKSGKTMLAKILTAIIPTTNICSLDSISLNKENVLTYITKLGLASNEFNEPFLYKKVKDELVYPLSNLGYPEHKINRKINKYCNTFEINDLLNKKLIHLNKSTRAKLLIILALIHEPKLLILDDAFLDMSDSDKEFMLKKLKELNEDGLTILNITSKIDTIYDSDRVILMKNFKILKEGSVTEILDMDSYLKECGIEIPYIVDLSLKLKFYNLIDKIYFNLEELEDALWQ